ncbi:hypothetical protein SPRG_01525 [Saprolegnia parasitica CBS 223.65]|uniref:PDZ domain-containing protein n=1 Tax=Saprolegnia parasitica (strain CBS 223.65) TaxID=695850 RepID=A0A067CUK0_SAPPC|nr:hypothetical protein SPRG_01525 [Saprolegnia parasitica CBS 223.65]KDO34389.1 hypothetical protein SPRG_01525 [Saprolegnia parasitica CBS 223.65]|eukprot:XP_012195125.1 hypothetical protein SPRG_01525 [Saprolegnia parasitica CBS 223.65]
MTLLVKKVLQRVPGERLGMTLISLNPNGPGSVFVSFVHPSTAAARANVCPGWEILELNTKGVDTLTVEKIGQYVAAEKGPITVIFNKAHSPGYDEWKKKNIQSIQSVCRKRAMDNALEAHEAAEVADAPTKRPTRASLAKAAPATQGPVTRSSPAKTTKKAMRSSPEPKQQTRKKHAPQPPLEPESTPLQAVATPEPKSKVKTKAKASVSSSPPPPESTPSKRPAPQVPRGQRQMSEFVVPMSAPSSPEPEEVSGPSRGSRAENAKMNLAIQRLMGMGFKRDDAILSYEKTGSGTVDQCMLWLVSYIEERKFLEDLNKAQIASELQKRTDDSQLKEKAQEELRATTTLRSLFPESVVFAATSQLEAFQRFIEDDLTRVCAENQLRTLVAELLTLEVKAKRWFGRPAECYVVQLFETLTPILTAHAPRACCCHLAATTSSCALVAGVAAEIAALKHHLYAMPSNTGGIPEAFLQADESLRYTLDDDGFEVLDVAKSSDDDDA